MPAPGGSPALHAAGGRSGLPVQESGKASDPTAAWAEVYDELRSAQSLASVLNDPRSGNRLTRGEVTSLEDFWDAVREGVEELSSARDGDLPVADEAAVGARTDELIGPVPEASELQPYLDTFREHWDAYHRNHQGRGSRRELAALGAAAGGGPAVPPEYCQSDFKLEHHKVFNQSLQASIEGQEEFNLELTGYLDHIELSLCEHIRRAERDQLFESLARMGEPLRVDVQATLEVVRLLRGRMRSRVAARGVLGLIAREQLLPSAVAMSAAVESLDRLQKGQVETHSTQATDASMAMEKLTQAVSATQLSAHKLKQLMNASGVKTNETFAKLESQIRVLGGAQLPTCATPLVKNIDAMGRQVSDKFYDQFRVALPKLRDPRSQVIHSLRTGRDLPIDLAKCAGWPDGALALEPQHGAFNEQGIPKAIAEGIPELIGGPLSSHRAVDDVSSRLVVDRGRVLSIASRGPAGSLQRLTELIEPQRNHCLNVELLQNMCRHTLGLNSASACLAGRLGFPGAWRAEVLPRTLKKFQMYMRQQG
ncbi:unnamed protein product [Prorocentrum cordatum]|uniref:Uncharacterized protein n=1 Tax=Prorocentrum cordatum TaxID=2364126 RepID=A0ABN9SVZ7_9DINO|nr:unnamed protein product [Polarella glacialis]